MLSLGSTGKFKRIKPLSASGDLQFSAFPPTSSDFRHFRYVMICHDISEYIHTSTYIYIYIMYVYVCVDVCICRCTCACTCMYIIMHQFLILDYFDLQPSFVLWTLPSNFPTLDLSAPFGLEVSVFLAESLCGAKKANNKDRMSIPIGFFCGFFT